MSENLSHDSCVIKKFSQKGYGLGKVAKGDSSWREVEVPYTIPQEHILIDSLKKAKHGLKGVVKELLSKSDDRTDPKCRHFGDCGGCKWQHIHYSSQLRFKNEQLKEKFSKKLDLSQAQFLPIASSPLEWQYRNKMEFSFYQNKAGYKALGLHKYEGAYQLVDLKECHLVHPVFMEVVEIVRGWWDDSLCEAYFPPKNIGSLRRLVVRRGVVTGDLMVVLTVSGDPSYALTKHQIDLFRDRLKIALEDKVPSLSIILEIQQICKGSATQFYEMVLFGPATYRDCLSIDLNGSRKTYDCFVSPSAFFQPNTLQAQFIYQKALELAGLTSSDTFLDLFCGTGTIGMCASGFVKHVIGIELNKASIYDAQENIKYNQISNVSLYQGDAGIVLQDLIASKKIPESSIVCVDPPRAGLGQTCLNILTQHLFPKIVYISCNPFTQADDLLYLQEKGYLIETVLPIDQFPQTPHLETIVLLKRI